MARIWRDGQTKPVHIYRLLSTGTIEEKILQRQMTKQGLGNALDASTAGTGSAHFSLEELRALFRLKEGTASETHDLLGCDCGISDALPTASTHAAAGKLSESVPSKQRVGETISALKEWSHLVVSLSASLGRFWLL